MPRGAHDRTKSKPRSKVAETTMTTDRGSTRRTKRLPRPVKGFSKEYSDADRLTDELQKMVFQYGSEGTYQILQNLRKAKIRISFRNGGN